MMGILRFKKLKKPDDEQALLTVEAAIDSCDDKVAYDPTLVSALKADHQRIMQLYTNIGILFQSRQFEELKDELSIFKTHLQAHLLVENVNFYNYLEQKLADDEINYEMMRDFRREMNKVAQRVISFIRKYRKKQFSDDSLHEFSKEYNKIGQLLSERINREESNLHVLYHS